MNEGKGVVFRFDGKFSLKNFLRIVYYEKIPRTVFCKMLFCRCYAIHLAQLVTHKKYSNKTSQLFSRQKATVRQEVIYQLQQHPSYFESIIQKKADISELNFIYKNSISACSRNATLR